MIKDMDEQLDKEICSVRSWKILSPGASVSRNLGCVTFPLCSLTGSPVNPIFGGLLMTSSSCRCACSVALVGSDSLRLPDHGVLQTRILEWVAISFSRDSSQPRDRTHILCGSFFTDGFFTAEPLGKPPYRDNWSLIPFPTLLPSQDNEGWGWKSHTSYHAWIFSVTNPHPGAMQELAYN